MSGQTVSKIPLIKFELNLIKTYSLIFVKGAVSSDRLVREIF